MSFWGATVITNLFSAIPWVGESIVTWLWGGFSVDNPTLNRFYSLHYLLPFVIFAVVALHVVAVHISGSNNPKGVDVQAPRDTVTFHPYFTAKDTVGLVAFLIFFAYFVFYAPNFFGEPDNYIKANPLQTPPHIVPEWYFLPFYAILRAIPHKLLGVIAMFASIAILLLLPWLDRSKVRSAGFRPRHRALFVLFVIDCAVLGVVGANPPEGAWVLTGQVFTFLYFAHFLIFVPLNSLTERPKPLPASISEPVLKENA